MRGPVRWEISAGAALLFSLLFFLDSSGVVSALFPAALTHELGHLAALTCCRCRLTRVRITLTGAQLDYAPEPEGAKKLLCIVSGPLAGFLYAFAACSVGGGFWQLSGSVSFLLSVFNCLPILPLDGGRIAAALLPERPAAILSLAAALLLLSSGAFLALRFASFPQLLMGAWLAACNLRLPGREK